MNLEVLKSKLIELGFAGGFVEIKLKEFDTSVLENNISITNDTIKVESYYRPTANISRFFMDVKQELIYKFVFDGDIGLKTKNTFFGVQMTVPDYSLSKKLCVIGVTKNNKIKIVVYNPGYDVQSRYAGRTYESQFESERNLIAEDYLAALTSGNRLNMLKAQDIMYVLLSEFIIDSIIIDNLNPKLKLYDNASKYAEAITKYELKYINRKVNKIEIAEKPLEAMYVGSGVKLGFVSNDPYLKIEELKQTSVDFYLNRPSYVWMKNNGKGQEEIAIYTAVEHSNFGTYNEKVKSENTVLINVAQDLARQFSNIVGYRVEEEFVYKIISKLNAELIVPSTELITRFANGNVDNIEPLKYRFKVITDSEEFEKLLYNSIEDNIGGRYRYRFVENVENELTVVGNKLNYTDVNGNKNIKQSIADFNVLASAAIIKRETIIDSASVSQLLGYMYDDTEYSGTYLLPVPSIEVNFFFPSGGNFEGRIQMYNGTMSSAGNGNYENNIIQQNDDERAVTVRYINSDGELLKENIIYRQKIGSVFIPEVIPIINDKLGREWICDSTQMINISVSPDSLQNVIEVKYIKKLVNVKINYINKQGRPVKKEVLKKMQVGESYDSSKDTIVADTEGTEWTLFQMMPTKMIVGEDESKNIITLVYDVKKAAVVINYLTKQGKILKEPKTLVTQANKKYVAEVQKIILDEDNLSWVYLEESNPTVLVEEEKENVINLLYTENKTRIKVCFLNEENQRIRDDIVELIQIGKTFSYEAESEFIDIMGKYWQIDSSKNGNVLLTESEKDNTIIFRYKKMLSRVHISFKNDNGNLIKNDIVETAQIGMEYTASQMAEITDNNGFMWKAKTDNRTLKIKDNENENTITYIYEPYMTNVTIRYIDVEGGELLPEKIKNVQVGSKIMPETFATLEGKDGRMWELSNNNKYEFVAKKHSEENIVVINYDKKMIDIKISFRSMNGLAIKEDEYVKLQLGSEYKNYNKYNKFITEDGVKWNVINTEPAKMYVKAGSIFTLIYAEMQAKVLVKCVELSSGKSIVDDTVITTKIGGVFAPNIMQKLLDKTKRKWKYIGEAGMSIIAKENDEENIIVLNYEQDCVNVTVRYLNDIGQKIKQDYIKSEQIGNEIAIKKLDKLIDTAGLHWKVKTYTADTLKVDENEEKNIVVFNYEKLLSKVTIKYLNDKDEEIIKAKEEIVQVGSRYRAEIIDRICSEKGEVWVKQEQQENEISIIEGSNIINLKYVPYKVDVVQKFENLTNETISKDIISKIQVGTIFIPKKIEEITDSEGKVWIYKNIDKEKITVSDNLEKNIIKHSYDKKMIKVIIAFKNDVGEKLKKDDELSLQIGSKHDIKAPNTLRDTDSLGWILGKNELNVKISKNESENLFDILYDKYMVNAYDKFVDESNKEIIAPKVTQHQVGSKYTATVEEEVIDEEGKYWVQNAKSDIKIFASSQKIETITIEEDDTKNNVYIKYKPKLANVTFKYQNTLGNQIKLDDETKAQIGSVYTAEAPEKLVDSQGNRWMYNPKSKATIKIEEDDTKNVIFLMYEEHKASVIFKYQDEYGKKLKTSSRKLVQIGTTYIPQFENVIEDETGKVWEYSSRDIEKLEVKDVEQDNVITLVYMPLNVDVTLEIINNIGEKICDDVIQKAQLGSEFKANIDATITDSNSLMYKFKKCEPETIKIRETPIGSTENLNKMVLTYEETYSNVIIKYLDFDGNLLKDEENIQLQVGKTYTAKPIQFIKDRRENQWELVNNEEQTVRVMENVKDNIIKFVYEVAKANILVRYKNVDGQTIKEDENYTEQVGNEFVPTIEKSVLGTDNRKWNFLNADPIKLKVGSINNIITLVYQEAKETVIVKYEDTSGRQIKGSDKILVQIGSRFKPKTNVKVIYEDNDIWRLDHTIPNEIVVSENKDENVITQVFTNKKVIQEEKTNKIELDKVIQFTPADELPDEEIVATVKEEKEEVVVESKVTFTDKYLQQLERKIKLTDDEKIVIQELNDYNTNIIELLHQSVNDFLGGKEFNKSDIQEIINKERETIEQKLMPLIEKDKTGTRILNIFEHIVASDENDALFRGLQQKKAILITDYYMNKPLSISEQATYICERGKISLKEKLIEEKLENSKDKEKNFAELVEAKSLVMYEGIMLDNYYKARSLPKDNYFTDNSVKASLAPEIISAVSNTLINQAFTLLQKNQNITLVQENELQAIIILLNDEQLATLVKQTEKIVDNKQRKGAQKLLQETIKKYKK